MQSLVKMTVWAYSSAKFIYPMIRFIISLLVFIHPPVAPAAAPRAVINAAPPAFETPQSRLWDRDVRDEANLPTEDEIKEAADATEALIRDEMQRIEKSVGSMRLENRPLAGCGDMGCEFNVAGWYAGKDLRKVEIASGGEVWWQRTELYFAKGTLIARKVHHEDVFGAYGSRYEVVQHRGSSEELYISPSEYSKEEKADLKLVEEKLGDHVTNP
jgi:hypothetical protein